MRIWRIAILIDGGFFLKRLPELVDAPRCATAEEVVASLRQLCQSHVENLTGTSEGLWHQHVYRIFYYDAVPFDGKAHHPIDNKPIDFTKTDIASFRLRLFEILRRERKVALRLGKVNKESDWAFRPRLTKKILHTKTAVNALNALGTGTDPAANREPVTITLSPEQARELIEMRDFWQSLKADAVSLGLKQKGVDMRIGIDIASMTLKRQVDTIVLVAGDSDFVPAGKLARREGVELILDPLGQRINEDLHEHIDGMHSGFAKPGPEPAAVGSPPALVQPIAVAPVICSDGALRPSASSNPDPSEART